MPLPATRWLQCCFALALALAAMPAFAENSVRSGDITVHHNALPSTELTPDIARQYGITRSANRALVNIAVRQGEPGRDRALAAQVTVRASNLAGQGQALRLREVREGDAIYYLAEARVSAPDTLSFEVEVVVEGVAPIRSAFRQEFHRQ